MNGISLNERFEGMAKLAFRPLKARGWKAVIQYFIEGPGGGNHYLVIRDQTCTHYEGVVDEPTLTITANVEDWRDITEGRLGGQEAYFNGKMRVSGNMNDLFRMQSVFSMVQEVLQHE
ncbi:MAG: SCP2 sterol-binding domain-containing protein [Candidatus Hermodarchaeota archaeon]